MLAIRKDLHAMWGVPAPMVDDHEVVHRTLESLMLPPLQVRHLFEAHALWESTSGMERKWVPGWEEKLARSPPGTPVCALKYGDGGFGLRAYVGATPALKHSALGPGGHTHLVIQRNHLGELAPRRQHSTELARKYDGNACGLDHPARPDHPNAAAIYGNSSPMDVLHKVMHHFIAGHLRPQ